MTDQTTEKRGPWTPNGSSWPFHPPKTDEQRENGIRARATITKRRSEVAAFTSYDVEFLLRLLDEARANAKDT